MTHLLETAEQFLRNEVAPRANDIDHDPAALRWALDGLCERGLMALRRPPEFGGPGLEEMEFRRYQETVARYSGALAFLQTQHQTAANMIAKGENERLKHECLPRMADGGRLIGIGFSQLRRPGPPVLAATPDDGGYRLSGDAPWVTGYGMYPEFMVGGTLPDGRAVFGLVPFGDSDRAGSARVSEPMRLAAMESAQTVSVRFESFLLRSEDVVTTKPAGWIHANDMLNVTLQGFFAIGCSLAGTDILAAAAERRKSDAIASACAALRSEVADCRTALAQAQSAGEELQAGQKLAARAWAIDLAVRCAHAAITASGGAANTAAHPAQRVYREALVYTVSAQTQPILEATLLRLAERSG